MRRLATLLMPWIVTAWTAAHGQMPFVTDDAGVTPKAGIHIESFDEFDWLQAAATPHLRQNTINGRLNVGLGNGLEFDLDAPLLTIYNTDAATPRKPFGIGDTEFGLKWNFRGAPDDTTPGASAFSGVFYIEVPTGNVASGLGSGLTDTWLYLVGQRTLGHQIVVHGNLGYLVTGNPATGAIGLTASGHVATMSASITRQFSPALNLGVELAGAVADVRAQSREQLQAMLGGTYALSDNFALALGLIGGHFAASPQYGIQIGFSMDR
jgi:hypothetical protein